MINFIQRGCDKANLVAKLQKLTLISIVKRETDLYKSYRNSAYEISEKRN